MKNVNVIHMVFVGHVLLFLTRDWSTHAHVQVLIQMFVSGFFHMPSLTCAIFNCVALLLERFGFYCFEKQPSLSSPCA